jgi:hypothetical protein
VSGEKKPLTLLWGLFLSPENKIKKKKIFSKARKEKNLFKGKIR